MFSKYLEKFPDDYTPSKSQVDLINEIEQAFKDGYKFVIASAPTGTGKSFIPKTLGSVSDSATPTFSNLVNSYDAWKQDNLGEYMHEDACLAEPPFGTTVLTITKQLQDQYKRLFKDTSLLKGKQNYTCTVDDNFDVETAPCILTPKLKNDCWKANCCDYYCSRNEALTNQFSATNYKMFLSLPGHVKRKNFIICDEASELEEELVKHYSADVNYVRLTQNNIEHNMLRSDDYDTQHRWLINITYNITQYIEELKSANNKKPKMGAAVANRLKFLKNLHGSLTTVQDNWEKCEYIVDFNKDGVNFTPLKINMLTGSIFNYAEHVVLMSATITDHKEYAKSLGIEKYKFVDIPSSFDANKSPIYTMTEPVLNYNNLQQNLPKLAKYCQSLCDHHANEKGIIHTHSMEICRYLQNKLIGTRFLFRDESTNNQQLLEEHFNNEGPTVLVSPSLTFGTDLHGNSGRFQIIVKTPFPPLSNKRIKKLVSIDQSWYERKTVSALIQTSGRCTRSKDDHSTTYILDGKAKKLLVSNKSKLPKHFVERLK
jgi:ATP-dependent DNA helicase DinG